MGKQSYPRHISVKRQSQCEAVTLTLTVVKQGIFAVLIQTRTGVQKSPLCCGGENRQIKKWQSLCQKPNAFFSPPPEDKKNTDSLSHLLFEQ